MNITGAFAHRGLECPLGAFEFAARLFIGVHQPLVVFDRELGVDRQVKGAVVAAPARHLDAELNPFRGIGAHRHVRIVLVGREALFQDIRQLNFPEIAAGFDVGEHFFQVSHAIGQRLHFAQALVDQIEPFADQFEGFVEALLHGFPQFFIHHLTHFIEFFPIVRLNILEPAVHCLTDFLQLPAEALLKPLQFPVVALGKVIHAFPELPKLPLLDIAEQLKGIHQFLPVIAHGAVQFLAVPGGFIAQGVRHRGRIGAKQELQHDHRRQQHDHDQQQYRYIHQNPPEFLLSSFIVRPV